MRIPENFKEKRKVIIKLLKEGHTFRGIKRIVNSNTRTIKKIAVLEKIPFKTLSEKKRIYNVNHSFFNKIDTEEKAYILGLFYADGCNFTKRSCISISLQENDVDILEKIKNHLFIDDKYQLKPVKISKNSLSKKLQIKLAITSKEMSDNLVRLGCINKKSLLITYPSENLLPKHLFHHFLRGVSDGDGWIGNANICIAGTFTFCKYIQKNLQSLLNIKGHLRITHNNGVTSSLEIGGNLQVDKYLDFLYKDATIYLDRKYNKFIERKEKRDIILNTPKLINYCKEPNCNTPKRAKGFCMKHYDFYRRNKNK